MRLWVLLPMLLVPLAAMGPPAAEAQGCTPCGCGVAFCHDGVTYWPAVENVTLHRDGGTVRVSWSLAAATLEGEAPPAGITFRGQDTVLAYDAVPHTEDDAPLATAYAHRLDVPGALYPGQQEATLRWGEELHVRVYGHGAASGEKVLEETRQVPAVPAALVLGALGLAAWRRR